jgi:hypothetical protein
MRKDLSMSYKDTKRGQYEGLLGVLFEAVAGLCIFLMILGSLYQFI